MKNDSQQKINILGTYEASAGELKIYYQQNKCGAYAYDVLHL